MNKPTLIPVSIYKDERGELRYCNEFDLSNSKRFYSISFGVKDQIRAWQGHKIETKSIIPIRGITKIVLVKVEDFENAHPGDIYEFILDSDAPNILIVPGGYANGFQSKSKDSSIMIFSDSSLEDSKNDDYRFDKDEFFKWN
ncbi:WxcM-like domain-containing protein [Algoriphagus lutimaris]|uniref:WxcM-like domain-containing protein n=1 Tax=Algoriphagus lutimaris TaxID=613197 RepID=UPI00196AAF18|nr:WxcM-like domain-containing protein [Algoriphagus lutimaris]MBN3518833.1 WxcM-like domain-containing protein [Algoriphagus lutimaris]